MTIGKMGQSAKQWGDRESRPIESRPRRLLVVDDSRLQRRILTGTLKKWGFDVVEAESGQEALALCRDALPDIVISDWVMPGMSGLAFCQAFRELSGAQYGYFILLTSKSEKSEVAKGLQAGADDFLTKPVDSDELRARITAGERIVDMQRELSEKNRLVQDTLDELQRVYDLLDNELLEAKQLQQSLIPERHKTFEEGALSFLLRSAGHVGGDLVGYFQADDGKLGMFAIDVSGHGISSALMTARLAGYLSSAAPDQNVALHRGEDGRYVTLPPADVVATLNELVLDEIETEQYFTFVLALVDMETGAVRMTQAGHPHPVVQRADGTVEMVGEGGFPVGLIPDMTFDQIDLSLHPGDRLILLSDGVTECPDPSEAMLGDNGLDGILTDLKNVSGPALFEALIWEMARFAQTEDFPDDVSGVLFEYRGPKSGQKT